MPARDIKRIHPDLWPAVMARAKELFPPNNPYGVFSFGIGDKLVEGVPRGYRTLVVHVRRKLQDPANPIPKIEIEVGGRKLLVTPDVIATGAEPRTHPGVGVMFSGLHSGAPIVAGAGTVAEAGGVGCLLTTGGKRPTHLITAGHLFYPGSPQPPPVFAGVPGSTTPVECGRLLVNLLDETARAEFQIDAALVELSDTKLIDQGPPPGAPSLTDVESVVQGQSYSVQAYRPTANSPSRVVSAQLLPNVIHLPAAPRPGFLVLEDVLQTSMPITQRGDSGTILFTASAPRRAVGSCVGRLGTSALFEPVSRSLQLFQRSIPGIRLWRAST